MGEILLLSVSFLNLLHAIFLKKLKLEKHKKVHILFFMILLSITQPNEYTNIYKVKKRKFNNLYIGTGNFFFFGSRDGSIIAKQFSLQQKELIILVFSNKLNKQSFKTKCLSSSEIS